MKIYLDGEEIAFPENSPSKEDVLASVKETLGKKGMLIRSIEVDGAELDEEAFLALSGGTEVRFAGRPVRDFLVETLADASEYQQRLASGLARAADHLEADRTPEGLELVGKAAEGIGWVLQIIHNSQILLGVDDSEVGGGGLGEVKSALLAELEKASRSVEEGKPLELAYTLRSGILPRIESLGGYISALRNIGDSTVQ
jgi:hypothetical protein